MILLDAFDEFILSRKLADLSPKSIRDYEWFVLPFVDFVGRDKAVDALQQADINKYIESLLKRNLSRNTNATYIRNVKVFLKWCDANYEVAYDYKRIRVPKVQKKNVKLYSDKELMEIFNHIHTESDWLTARNKCIVAFMVDSGLRQAEVCNLLRSDISFDIMVMTVRGKGGKERIVPLGNLSADLLRSYWQLSPYSGKYVFTCRHGNPLTTNAVKLLISKLSKELSFDLSSHKLRHNFATNYCLDQYETRGQVDIYKLMILMGHEDVETTQRYLHHAMEVIASKNNISHLDRVYRGET